MTRWIPAILSLVLAGPALADWTRISTDVDIYSAFADKDSIRRNGSSVTMVGLYDFRKQDFTPTGKGVYSTVVLREYDCRERRVRLMSSIDFSGHMGSGEPVETSNSVRRWEPVVEGGIDELYWKFACG